VNKPITILAIESSCDETAASIVVDGKILSNFIANQTIHEKYGGVVPELASRAHMENIVPVVDASLKKAFPTLSKQLSLCSNRCHSFYASTRLDRIIISGCSIC